MAVIYGTIGPDTRNGTRKMTLYGWADGNGNSVSGDDKLYGQAGNDKLFVVIGTSIALWRYRTTTSMVA